MTTKKCSKCSEEKLESDFHQKGKYLQSHCKDCQRKYVRQHYKANKKYYVDKAAKQTNKLKMVVRLAKDKPCADCGHRYPYYVMDFDHLQNKEFNISTSAVKYGIARTLKEIDKCEVVCSNCHRIRTHNRQALVHPLATNQLKG